MPQDFEMVWAFETRTFVPRLSSDFRGGVDVVINSRKVPQKLVVEGCCVDGGEIPSLQPVEVGRAAAIDQFFQLFALFLDCLPDFVVVLQRRR